VRGEKEGEKGRERKINELPPVGPVGLVANNLELIDVRKS
jgi:hypothetical protein